MQVFGLSYRAPELFFNCSQYTTSVDMWAAGCIFAELMLRRPWFPGRTELQTINNIMDTLGWPTQEQWPGMNDLPDAKAYLSIGHKKGAVEQVAAEGLHLGILAATWVVYRAILLPLTHARSIIRKI